MLLWILLGIGTALVLFVIGYALIKTWKQKSAKDKYPDVDGPGQGIDHRSRFDRIAPLFYERGGKNWKVSLGRVSFWLTMITFLAMCVVVMVSLGKGQDINTGMATLYLGAMSSLFLTNIGLLAYNLGTKFSEPMKGFIVSWNKPNSKSRKNYEI